MSTPCLPDGLTREQAMLLAARFAHLIDMMHPNTKEPRFDLIFWGAWQRQKANIQTIHTAIVGDAPVYIQEIRSECGFLYVPELLRILNAPPEMIEHRAVFTMLSVDPKTFCTWLSKQFTPTCKLLRWSGKLGLLIEENQQSLTKCYST